MLRVMHNPRCCFLLQMPQAMQRADILVFPLGVHACRSQLTGLPDCSEMGAVEQTGR